MTKHTPTAFLFTLFVGIALGPTLAQGKRSPPAEVPPVVNEGVRYEAPHFNNPCGQNGGCVVAYDNASGALMWSTKVYCTRYDAQLETDVQDVFITSLAIDTGKLEVTNEKSFHFVIDVDTRAISGDASGCSDSTGSGCSLSSSLRSRHFLSVTDISRSAAWKMGGLERGRRPNQDGEATGEAEPATLDL